MATGWIALKRDIWDNPLWQDEASFDRRSAYIDMLLQAGYTDKKVIVGGCVVDVEWGQFVTSQDKLAERWRWGRQQVRSFLKLLEQAEIIKIATNRKYTVITMVRDISRPSDNQQNNQQITNSQPTDQPSANQQLTTTNKYNNINNINNINKENQHHQDAGGGIVADVNNPFVLWESYGFGTFSYQLAEDLKSLIADTSEAVVCEAIKIAAKANKKFFSYVESVALRIASGEEYKHTGTVGGFSGFSAIIDGLCKGDAG